MLAVVPNNELLSLGSFGHYLGSVVFPIGLLQNTRGRLPCIASVDNAYGPQYQPLHKILQPFFL